MYLRVNIYRKHTSTYTSNSTIDERNTNTYIKEAGTCNNVRGSEAASNRMISKLLVPVSFVGMLFSFLFLPYLMYICVYTYVHVCIDRLTQTAFDVGYACSKPWG